MGGCIVLTQCLAWHTSLLRCPYRCTSRCGRVLRMDGVVLKLCNKNLVNLAKSVSPSRSAISLMAWGELLLTWGPFHPLLALAVVALLCAQCAAHRIAEERFEAVWEEEEVEGAEPVLFRPYLYFGIFSGWLLSIIHMASIGISSVVFMMLLVALPATTAGLYLCKDRRARSPLPHTIPQPQFLLA